MAADMEFLNRVFHAGLRRDLTRILAAADVPEAGPEQRRALVGHLELMLDLLHHHHTSEDEGLWPLARRRAPDLAAQLDRMEAEHATVAVAIAATRAAAARYAAEPSAAGDLRQAVVALQEALLPHLDHEETEVMPRVMRALSRQDWSALARRELRSSSSLALAGNGLLWSSEGLDPEQRARFERQVPGLLRWFVAKRYGSAYRHRVALAFASPTAGG